MRFSAALLVSAIVGVISVAANPAPAYGAASALEIVQRCYPSSCQCDESRCWAGPACCANGSCPC
ncbi:hypothetical protein GALMADRAFT_259504 [Galerina marginata CBS 339.88]|uniref:Uncharacterized protein n=1 Tax=Galerina marginata (strain CBS 339.88) TaxID=685588 RepID=A0A067SI06_GALM3|nr:hypothetical protein GALMADRAFT_259504 [Galerina marginata CBS 339.88]